MSAGGSSGIALLVPPGWVAVLKECPMLALDPGETITLNAQIERMIAEPASGERLTFTVAAQPVGFDGQGRVTAALFLTVHDENELENGGKLLPWLTPAPVD